MKKLFLLSFLCCQMLCSFSQTGNVGIGITTPAARLHVTDSNVLFSASAVLPLSPGNPPVEGGGRRMMWYAAKAAFRAGIAFGNQWDKDSIGILSIALGNSTKAKGESSFASGAGTNALGNQSTATGDFTTASGNGSFSAGFRTVASGDYSFAAGTSGSSTGFTSFSFGQLSTATSNTAIAMGINAKASSFSSLAIGQDVRAASQNSIALGRSTFTTGNIALAAGFMTKATADYSTVFGSFNDTTETAIYFNPQAEDRIFQIGNGLNNNNRKNALTILRNGYTGIGTVNPAAGLHVADNDVVFTGPATLPVEPANTPVIGGGSRMMWYPDKAAFRAGSVLGNEWNKENIGNYSFAAGQGSIASGPGSISLGAGNTASGFNSFATGNGNTASSSVATAFGANNIASGAASLATGADNIASGFFSTVMGRYNKAKSSFSLVAGFYNDTTANNRLFEVGNGSADNARSNAMTVLLNGNTGIGTANPAKRLEVVGPESAIPVTVTIANRGGFGPAALEFVSDYGFASQWRPGYIRSNDLGSFTGTLEFFTNGTSASGGLNGNVKGFEVRNGAALTATGAVGSYSDGRLKNNTTAFTDGLNVIAKIKPVQFYYNKDAPFPTDKQQTGIIAQELEMIAPYMIEKNIQNGYEDLRSVNNQAFTYLLINAVKEQQQQIEKLQQEMNELKTLIKKFVETK